MVLLRSLNHSQIQPARKPPQHLSRAGKRELCSLVLCILCIRQMRRPSNMFAVLAKKQSRAMRWLPKNYRVLYAHFILLVLMCGIFVILIQANPPVPEISRELSGNLLEI